MKHRLIILVAISSFVFSLAGVSFCIPSAEAATGAHLASKSGSTVIGGKKAIKVKGVKSGAKVSYKSANKAIAKVTSKGKATGIKAGKAKIKVTIARSGSKRTLSYQLTVKKPKLSKKSLVVAKGKTLKLSIKNKPKKASYKWSLKNGKIASVSKAGKIKGKSTGTTRLTVKVKTKAKTYKLTGKVKVKNANTLSADTLSLPSTASTNVVFSCKASKNDKSVVLYAQGGSKVGSMHDDGEDGDLSAGDGTYTYIVSIDPRESSRLSYYAKNGKGLGNTVSLKVFDQEDLEKSESAAATIDSKLASIEDDIDLRGNDDQIASSVESAYNGIVSYLDQAKREGTIQSYSKTADTFSVKLPYFTYVYTFSPLEDYQASGKTGASSRITAKAASTQTSATATHLNGIITAQPYASELRSTTFDNAAKEVEAANLGYSFARDIDDENVSIEALKHLSDYRLIIWDGHGGYSKDSRSFLGTGEPTEGAASKYATDIANGRIIYLSGGKLGITSGFFKRYYRNSKLDNCLIYLGACHSQEDSTLSSALRSVGAKAVLGFKSSVKTSYNREICETFFRTLTSSDNSSGKTVTAKTALDKAKSAHGESDPYTIPTWWDKVKAFFGWAEEVVPATPVLTGDTSFRLSGGNEQASTQGTISGRICKAQDSSAMDDVAVNFFTEDGATLKKNVHLRSEDEGYYSIKLPAGTYKMVAAAEGYVNFISYVEIEEGATTYSDTFYMSKASDGQSAKIDGTICDAVTGNALDGVSLVVRRGWNNTGHESVVASSSTDDDGDYNITLPIGNYTIALSKDGYIETSINVYNSPYGSSYTFDAGMFALADNDVYRITLTWGENPRDLDSHVRGKLPDGTSFHVYYSHESAYYGDDPICSLDHDDTTSYGPETITLKASDTQSFYYYVYRYAGTGTVAGSNATLTIYKGNDYLTTMHVPTSQGSGDYWNAFAIKNGQLVIRDTVSSSADTDY